MKRDFKLSMGSVTALVLKEDGKWILNIYRPINKKIIVTNKRSGNKIRSLVKQAYRAGMISGFEEGIEKEYKSTLKKAQRLMRKFGL